MLNADSSTLKSESDDQRRKTPPTIPRVAALSCTRWTSERMLSTELLGNARLELLDEEVRRVRAVDEAEQREREEDERHEREQGEVGDHRGEMRAAVGEELRQEGSLPDAHERELLPRQVPHVRSAAEFD